MHFKTNEPVYKQVADLLRRDIASGRLSDKIPGERELSTHYGVNFKTANKAVSTLVEKGLLARIRGKGTFVARGGKRTKLETIGLLVPQLQNPYFAKCVEAIERAATKAGISVLLNTTHSPCDAGRFVEALSHRGAHGLIVNGDPIALRKHAPAFPIVGFGAGTPDSDYVTADVGEGARLAMEHLIARFGGEIGYIGAVAGNSDERIQGYRTALAAGRFPVRSQWIQIAAQDYRGGYSAAKTLLSRKPRPRSLFVYNDYMAIGAERAIAELGLRVPGDVAVMGFDDSANPGDMVVPTTSVRFSYEKLARSLLLLVKRRTQSPDASPRLIHIAPKLMVRQSTSAK